MRYLESTLGDEEVVLAEAKFHWTWDFTSFVWFIVFGWIIIGIYMAIIRTVEEWTTELAVTNRRFVYKRGFIVRDTNEFAIDRIESVLLKQGFWGRVLNFGKLIIRGSGIGEIDLPTIDKPLDFRRALLNASQAAQADAGMPQGNLEGELVAYDPDRSRKAKRSKKSVD